MYNLWQTGHNTIIKHKGGVQMPDARQKESQKVKSSNTNTNTANADKDRLDSNLDVGSGTTAHSSHKK
jgi:hypothetical protein